MIPHETMHETGLAPHSISETALLSDGEEEETFDDIPPDSLWAFYNFNRGAPDGFIYFGGRYVGNRPVLSVYPSWAYSQSAEMFTQFRVILEEQFLRMVSEGKLVRVDLPEVLINHTEEAID